MKKLRLAVALIGAALASCFATSYSEPQQVQSVVTRTMQKEIHWNEWTTNDPNVNYHYVTLRWDFLTEQVVNYGTVVAYVYDGTYQKPLPYIYPVDYTLNDGSHLVVPQDISFDIRPGEITFIRQDLDGNMPEGTEYTAPLVFRAVATVPVMYEID